MVVMQFNSFNPEMGWFFELAKLQCGYHKERRRPTND